MHTIHSLQVGIRSRFFVLSLGLFPWGGRAEFENYDTTSIDENKNAPLPPSRLLSAIAHWLSSQQSACIHVGLAIIC